jgi:hypothetical protein
MWSGRRSAGVAALILVLALLALASVGLTFSAFSATTTNAGNSFTAAPDFVPCTATTTVVAKTAGYTPGYVKQGGTYYVYANVSDTGNPASGVATVTANMSSIDSAGATNVALASGSFSVGGVSYGYRSASRTIKNPLAAGTYTYAITCVDNASNSGTQSGFSVVVDNTVPTGADVQAVNASGGTVGRAELGDTITFTFSEPMDPNSILAGWSGASTNVVVRLNDGGGGNDTIQIWNSSNGSQLPLGQVNLGRTDYTSSNRTFGASGTPSAMIQSGASITVTLGTASGAVTTAAGTGTMVWTPSNTATDRAGNSCSTANATESGSADKEF